MSRVPVAMEDVESEATPPPVGPSLSDLAWMAVLPTVAVLLPAMIWLAPPLAEVVMPQPSWHPFPTIKAAIAPEPVEHLRYLMALFAPLLAAGFALSAWRASSSRAWVRRGWHTVAAGAVQLSVVAVMAYCWVDQSSRRSWFSTLNVSLGLIFAGAVLLLLRRSKWRVKTSSPRVGAVVIGVAAVLTGLWLLPAIFGDSSIAHADGIVRYHLQFTMNELLTVANGRTPLVNFVPQYTKLLPFLFAPMVSLAGVSVGTVTATMWVLSVVSLLAVYLTFKAVTDNGVVALGLYVPFLAVSLFMTSRTGPERSFLANLYGVVPLRVVGPFVVAWLLTLELRRPRRFGQVALFVVASLVAVNNFEYGLPCLGGAVVGLWCGRGAAGWSRARARRLITDAIIGAALAAASVCLLTLVTAGSLPDPQYVSQFNRVFAIEGFGLVPMPAFGLHVVFFVTFCGALVVALVASATRSELANRSPVLVGALGYSGVLGVGAFSYWVGRSHSEALFAVFPTWGFTVGLLSWLVLHELESGSRSSVYPWTQAVPAIFVLTSFGVMATVIPQLPSPAGQFRRLSGHPPTVDAPASGYSCATTPRPEKPCSVEPESFRHSSAVEFVDANTKPGERVMILAGLGHLIARESHVINVSPYSHPDDVLFFEQMGFLLEAFDRTDGTKIFLGLAYPEITAELKQRGFVPVGHDDVSELTEWVPGGQQVTPAPSNVVGG